ncbi:hypothetical protein XELAEV_18032271mg [Xenopus laevis]|uniref:Uncharacterized protein n=1 Tax=Xenopus laevis TaxID=8355 RepID=A0A974CQS5_XENLA|nr:hypothetical protein XELAEV_18032271mg [Xenopus laevis]
MPLWLEGSCSIVRISSAEGGQTGLSCDGLHAIMARGELLFSQNQQCRRGTDRFSFNGLHAIMARGELFYSQNQQCRRGTDRFFFLWLACHCGWREQYSF